MVVIGVDDRSVYLEDPDPIGMRPVMDRDEFVQAWHNYEGKIAFGSRCLHQGRGTRRAPVLYNPGCDAGVCAGGPKDPMMVVDAGQGVLRRHPGRI